MRYGMGDARHDGRGSVYVWVSWDEKMKRRGDVFYSISRRSLCREFEAL